MPQPTSKEEAPSPSRGSLLLRGTAMGIADSVPGVSGGTVAFITGIYPQLLTNLRALGGTTALLLLKGRWRQALCTVDLPFLLLLFGGAGMGLLLFAHVIHLLLHHPIGRTYLFSFFCGLILASALFCARRVKQWRGKHSIALCSAVVITFFLVGLGRGSERMPGPYSVPLRNVEVEGAANYQPLGNLVTGVSEDELLAMRARGIVSPETPVWHAQLGRWAEAGRWGEESSSLNRYCKTLFAGAAGGSAMLLPGISGAYLLNILGYYEPSIAAVADLTHALRHGSWDGESAALLASLAMGVVVGVVVFSRVVYWLLRRWESVAIASLTGVMLGALRSLWPFWSYEWVIDPVRPASGLELQPVDAIIPALGTLLLWGALLFSIIGFLLVWVIEAVAAMRQRRQEA